MFDEGKFNFRSKSTVIDDAFVTGKAQPRTQSNGEIEWMMEMVGMD